MAVYTRFPVSDLEQFLLSYSLGELTELREITQGVENSNYFLTTTQGMFVLTLFEKRTDPEDLPFFLSLTDHLAEKQIPCPVPMKRIDGTVIGRLADRPAVVISFLPGSMKLNPSPADCFQVGEMLAKMHVAVADFSRNRINNLAVKGWETLWQQCRTKSEGVLEKSSDWMQESLDKIRQQWPTTLPSGIIHADLFPDNVFFGDGQLSGVIDFYFACSDFLAYDLAICINAWCFPKNEVCVDSCRQMVDGYQGIRKLEKLERDAFSVLCQGAATRFLLTRLYDWINTPPDALVEKKDPNDYVRRLVFHQNHNVLSTKA